eukprot:1195681-Prorocentrum_minimum.AAC.1
MELRIPPCDPRDIVDDIRKQLFDHMCSAKERHLEEEREAKEQRESRRKERWNAEYVSRRRSRERVAASELVSTLLARR